MRVLESERIRLKPVEEDDLQYLLDLRWNKLICDTIVHELLTYEKQVEWFKTTKNAQHFTIFSKIESGSEIRVGTIGLFEISTKHQRAKWTLRIHPDHWRKGYARESVKLFLDYVFNTMNINKLMGDCFTENIAEVNNLRKLGFREEGIWKEHYFHKGAFKDSIQFVMTRNEYRQLISKGLI